MFHFIISGNIAFRFIVISVMTAVLAVAGSPKYSHDPLMSIIGGRSRDYPSIIGSSSGDSKVNFVSSNVNESSAMDKKRSPTSSISSLDAGPGRGGEVLAAKSFPKSSEEPTCEQLRAMWIFSKRQSRAAEITNEIPTYRDPFTYNIWEPYYSTTRSLGIRMVPRYGDRTRSPVFGRVISREPILPQRLSFGQRQRQSEETNQSRIYGSESKPTGTAAAMRRPSKYRYIGANVSPANDITNENPQSAAIQGSFQKLKELIWTERAKELTQQRRAEEIAARAAVLKEITNGQNIQSYKQQNLLKTESPLMDENRSPDREHNKILNNERFSIVNEQLKSNNQRKSKDRLLSSITRSFGKKGYGIQKPFIFSSNPLSLSQRESSLYMLRMPKISESNQDFVHQFSHHSISGVPRTYPIRSSNFRERNRSFFKPGPSSEYFQRNVRTRPIAETQTSVQLPNHIDSKTHTYAIKNDEGVVLELQNLVYKNLFDNIALEPEQDVLEYNNY